MQHRAKNLFKNKRDKSKPKKRTGPFQQMANRRNFEPIKEVQDESERQYSEEENKRDKRRGMFSQKQS